MKIEQIINGLQWTIQEKRLITDVYFQYRNGKKMLEDIIAKKMTEMKFRLPFDGAKYFCVSYDPSFYNVMSPLMDIGNSRIVYEEFTIDMAVLHAMIKPVILKHLEWGGHPSHVMRLIIGPELKNALTRGRLPEYQFEFGCESQFRIVYCPDITGIAVIP